MSTLDHQKQNLPSKPKFGDPCNGCGYCCTQEPCELAQEFLGCTVGSCVALETRDGRTVCGLVRNPQGYLYQAAHPHASVPLLDEPPLAETATLYLSRQIATTLGIGLGCDAADE